MTDPEETLDLDLLAAEGGSPADEADGVPGDDPRPGLVPSPPVPPPPDLKARIEALLFSADEPRTVRWMANYLKVEGRFVRRTLDDLRLDYSSRPGALEVREVLMNRGRIVSPAGTRVPDQSEDPDEALSALETGDDEDAETALDLPPEPGAEPPVIRAVPAYQIAIRMEFRDLVQRLLPPELAKPVLGTLSMIAVRQPILQSEIIRIRGKRAYMHIKDLLAHRLIVRHPIEGSYELSTTPEFSRRYQIDPEAARELRKTSTRRRATGPARAAGATGAGLDEAGPSAVPSDPSVPSPASLGA